MPAVLVTVATVMQNKLHPLSTDSITAHHLLDFMVQGWDRERQQRQMHRQSVWTPPHPHHWCPNLHHPPIFMLDALSATTVPIYPALGQALNNAGLYIPMA